MRLVVDCEAGRHQDSAPIEVDLSDTGLDEREQDSRVELQGVVGRAGTTSVTTPSFRPPSSSTSRPTSWNT